MCQNRQYLNIMVQYTSHLGRWVWHMEKIVIIINGSGGVGKDTLCDFAAKHYRVQAVSSITPIKEIARKGFGWDGQKDSKSRKLLADLKELAVKYNDLPFLYLCREYERFLNSRAQILFVHIREGKEIDKFKNQVSGTCYTLLITRKLNENVRWGNVSDDNVEKYEYDWIYENNKSLKETEQDFCDFLLRHTEGKLYRENIFSKIKNCKKNFGYGKGTDSFSKKYIKMSQ